MSSDTCCHHEGCDLIVSDVEEHDADHRTACDDALTDAVLAHRVDLANALWTEIRAAWCNYCHGDRDDRSARGHAIMTAARTE